MSESKDAKATDVKDGHGQAADTGSEERSGRVGYDARGNPIWEWRLEAGVYSRDINTEKLKKLSLNDLSLAETARNQRPPGLTDPQPAPSSGQGANSNSGKLKVSLDGLSLAETARNQRPPGLSEPQKAPSPGQGVNSNTEKLKKYSLDELSLAETAPHPRPPGLTEPPTAPLPGRGVNPYDNSPPMERGTNPYDNAPAPVRKVQPPPSRPPAPAPAARKATDLRKLDDWMQMKKRLENQKKD